MIKTKIIIIFSLISFFAFGQNKRISDFFTGKTEIPSPLELRDPFKAPLIKKKKAAEIGQGVLRDGVFTNIPTAENLGIDELAIRGVFFGKDRRAIGEKVNQEGNSTKEGTFIIKEGMKVGREKAEVKAILPGGIVIVEKIVNVYGQEEYLETIIPISK